MDEVAIRFSGIYEDVFSFSCHIETFSFLSNINNHHSIVFRFNFLKTTSELFSHYLVNSFSGLLILIYITLTYSFLVDR